MPASSDLYAEKEVGGPTTKQRPMSLLCAASLPITYAAADLFVVGKNEPSVTTAQLPSLILLIICGMWSVCEMSRKGWLLFAGRLLT